MKITIVLKKQDADGLGGEILSSMGMKRSEFEPQVFSVQHVQDPRRVAPVDVLESMWAIQYAEALMDAGIRPVRIFQKTDSTAGLTPFYTVSSSVEAPPKPSKRQIADVLEAAANVLEGASVINISEMISTAAQMGKPCVLTSDEADMFLTSLDEHPGFAKLIKTEAYRVIKNAVRSGNDAKLSVRDCGDLLRFLPRSASTTKASKGVIDKKTWKMIREKVNDALEKAGFDGNGRFKNIADANNKIADVLRRYGLQLADVMSADLFREPSKTHNFRLEFINPMDSFSPIAFDDSMLRFSYFTHDTGRVEVVAYLS